MLIEKKVPVRNDSKKLLLSLALGNLKNCTFGTETLKKGSIYYKRGVIYYFRKLKLRCKF